MAKEILSNPPNSTQMTKPEELTDARKNTLLKKIVKCGNVNTAAGLVGVSPATVQRQIKNDSFFKEAVDIAKAQYLSGLEEAAYKRAVDGVEEDVYFQGQKVGTQTKYSDKLLETLLKANDPERYSTKVQNQTNNTLVVGDESTVAALGKFLGVDMDNKPSEKAVGDSGEDIIDGEYDESDE